MDQQAPQREEMANVRADLPVGRAVLRLMLSADSRVAKPTLPDAEMISSSPPLVPEEEWSGAETRPSAETPSTTSLSLGIPLKKPQYFEFRR